jgi:pyruvyltransferase
MGRWDFTTGRKLAQLVSRAKWLLIALLQYHVLIAWAEEMIPSEGPPLFYWHEKWRGRTFINFGDYLSLKLVEKIVNGPVRPYIKGQQKIEKKLLAIGSIISFASNEDIVWGSGINGKLLSRKDYKFKTLDVRSVRGPLSRTFLKEHLGIDCPEVYGDPALLFPHFFPEFKRKEQPAYDYIIIPHYSEEDLFPKEEWDNVVFSTDPWEEVLERILDSRFVVSSSLHAIIIAESYGIPARLLRVTNNESIFKYEDYYSGTGRPNFSYAISINEALEMGGEPPPQCNLEKLYRAFPFDYWPSTNFQFPKLPQN